MRNRKIKRGKADARTTTLANLVLQDKRIKEWTPDLYDAIKYGSLRNKLMNPDPYEGALSASIRKLLYLRELIEENDIEDKIVLLDLYKGELAGLMLLSLLE